VGVAMMDIYRQQYHVCNLARAFKMWVHGLMSDAEYDDWKRRYDEVKRIGSLDVEWQTEKILAEMGW